MIGFEQKYQLWLDNIPEEYRKVYVEVKDTLYFAHGIGVDVFGEDVEWETVIAIYELLNKKIEENKCLS
jgi:hypothetical protein